MYTLILSSFCTLYLMLLACKPNFAETALTTRHVEQALYKGLLYIYQDRGPDSSVGIATGYGLDDPGIESR